MWLLSAHFFEALNLIIQEKHLLPINFRETCFLLSNIAASSLEMREIILKHEFFQNFLSLMKTHIRKEHYLDYCWTLKIFLLGDKNDESTYPDVMIATKMIDITARIFIDSYAADVVEECIQGFIAYLQPNIEQEERSHYFIHIPNLVYHLNRCLFESNFPMIIICGMLQVLERLAQSSEETIQAVFCNESDLTVTFSNEGLLRFGQSQFQPIIYRSLSVCRNLIRNSPRLREDITKENTLLNICVDILLNGWDSKIMIICLQVLISFFECVPVERSVFTVQRRPDVVFLYSASRVG